MTKAAEIEKLDRSTLIIWNDVRETRQKLPRQGMLLDV